MAQRQGTAAVQAARELHRLVLEAQVLPLAARLEHINRNVNRRIRYASDREVWGREDHWASPLELWLQGRGDCEDYAVAKFALLRAAGVPDDALRLTHVQATRDGQRMAHLVLVVQEDDETEPLVLDNLIDEVRSAGQRPDLAPSFSFNLAGLWLPTGESAGDPLLRLSSWRDLVRRLQDEGLR